MYSSSIILVSLPVIIGGGIVPGMMPNSTLKGPHKKRFRKLLAVDLRAYLLASVLNLQSRD